MDHRLTRRGFLKVAGLTGATLLGAPAALAQAPAVPAQGAPPLTPKPIPTRPLGRTGVNVPVLALGGMFDTRSAQLFLRQTLAWGVTHWDTADCYENGNSEEGFGRYFQRSPQDRARVFLVTKSDATDPAGMTTLLEQSLRRLSTTTIDLYLLHGIKDADVLTPAVKEWAARNKAEGRIRHFGFSCHKRMETLLNAAATLGWIDVVMTAVNYRLLADPKMSAALESCRGAGVGIIGMKFKGGGPITPSDDAEARMAAGFLKRGFTPEQAMLKALWEHPAIATVCARMTSFGTLQEYVAAAFDKTTLALDERDALHRFADQTRETFCRACGACEDASGGAPIADAMRCLMYENAYGDIHRAREAFRAIPVADRARLNHVDWTAAERACPHGLPIARLLDDAHRRLDV